MRYVALIVGTFLAVLTFVDLQYNHNFNVTYTKRDQARQIRNILVIMPGELTQVHGISNRYKQMRRVLARQNITLDIMDAKDADFKIGSWNEKIPENMTSFSLPAKYIQKYLSGMYDAVHIAEIISFQSFMAAMTFGYYQVPFTLMCHINYDIYNKEYGDFIPEKWHEYIVRLISKPSACVFAPTKGIVDILRNKYGLKKRKIVTLPNGVDFEVFNAQKKPEDKIIQEEFANYKRPILLCVARVAPEKNLEDFYNLKYPGTKIMVGDGPNLARDRVNHPDVIFVGCKQGYELAVYYRNADVFVFPSRSETFGVVMVEAMACGTPVAAYPCTGPIDVVANGVTGVLNDDLAKAAEECLRLSRVDVAKNSAKWSWETAANMFLDNLVYIPASKRASLASIY